MFAYLASLLLASPLQAKPLLGASLYGGKDGFSQAQLAQAEGEGFKLVSLVPTYPYIDLNRVDLSGGPSWKNVQAEMSSALSLGIAVVLKPHLDPATYITGYKPPEAVKHGWRLDCPWRGFFDVDPMSDDYREGIVLNALKAVSGAFKPGAPPVRLELGAELMNSTVYQPERWAELLNFAKLERRKLGLEGKVLFSHNFEHHFEIPADSVKRMTPEGRRALARYIKGLDALALSQYMDLTAAMPKGEQGGRLPTADEVAQALAFHESNFRREVLEAGLGLKPGEIPPIHIGEFGVGTGGLKQPNLWAGNLSPEQERKLDEEIARGDEGLARFLETAPGATTAALWLVGPHFDIFGWGNPAYAVPAAEEAVRAYLRAPIK